MDRLLDVRGPRVGITWPRRGERTRRATLGALARPRTLRRRTLRRRLLAGVATLALVGLAWVGLRASPLVSVTHVRVSGVHGLYGAQIERALTAAARRQSTMAVDVHALRAAVAPYGVVRDLRVSAGFPHTLRITVIEQLPVATLTSPDGHAAAAAGDGTVLGPALAIAGIPTISVPALPVRHVSDPRLLAQLQVLVSAPAVLLRRVGRIVFGPQGLTVVMRNGLQIYFGDASRAHAKWLAAELVIADRTSTGASYVDVRVTDRPTAGGLPVGASAGGSVAAGTAAGASSQAGLAATLAAALGGSTTPVTGAGATGATTTPATTPPTTATAGANPAPAAAPVAAPAAAAPPATATSAAPGGASTSTGG